MSPPNALVLPEFAERSAVVQTLRSFEDLSLAELSSYAETGTHADVLASVRIGELLGDRPELDEIDRAIIHVFEAHPAARLPSSIIITKVGIPRWVAQKRLGGLVAWGLLHRSGKTSSTRYWLAGG